MHLFSFFYTWILFIDCIKLIPTYVLEKKRSNHMLCNMAVGYIENLGITES